MNRVLCRQSVNQDISRNVLERLKEVANSSVIPSENSENSERPHFWQEHCPFESH